MTSRLSRFALALAFGTLGGLVFNLFQMPLAWMLGAMTACTVASMAGAPIAPLDGLRPFMQSVIGVLLGASFPPDLLNQVLGWLPSMAGLAVFILIVAAIGTIYFRFLAGFDLPTAFFSAMPGGIVEMMALGRERGGDERLIALVQTTRILLVLAGLPYFLVIVFGVELEMLQPAVRGSMLDSPWTSHVWLVACALLGMALGKLLRLPAKYLIGPMLLSAVVHVSAVSDFQPANEVVIVAQLILGSLVGSRFAGVAPKLVLRLLLLSAGSVLLILCAGSGIAVAVSLVTTVPPEALMLAYAPGGLTEMGLVALTMGIEVAFVAAHHLARVLFVVLTASVLYAMVQKK